MFSCHVYIFNCLIVCHNAACLWYAPGHVPAQNPHHSIVFCVHAGENVGFLPMALAARPHGRSHSRAGTIKQSLRCPIYAALLFLICFCWGFFFWHIILFLSLHVFNPHSGRQWLTLILSGRSWQQAHRLWGWRLSWWPVCPVVLQEFTLRKFSRRLNRVFGSVIFSSVSKSCLFSGMGRVLPMVTKNCHQFSTCHPYGISWVYYYNSVFWGRFFSPEFSKGKKKISECRNSNLTNSNVFHK